MDYEYTTPRKRIHLDEDAYMDVDSPPRRPLHPAPSPFASVPPRGPQPPAPSSNFTFDSTSLPYEAFSSARRRSEPTKEVILAPLDGTTDELSTQLGAARVDEPAPSTARRRSKRQGSPKRKLKAKIREDDQPGQLAAPTPSHHYSLHQHHYSAPGEREGDGRHRWREEVPLVMLGYVQVLFNAALVGLALWLLFGFVSTIRYDVAEKIDGYSMEIRQEILHCSSAYIANNCDPATRVPALAAACTGWEHCMNRDPRVVGRARVGAETFAEVLDSFVNAISWKTMLFLFLATALVVTLTNSAIGNVRHRLSSASQHYPPYPPPYNDRPALPHWPASAPARLDAPIERITEDKSWLRFW